MLVLLAATALAADWGELPPPPADLAGPRVVVITGAALTGAGLTLVGLAAYGELTAPPRRGASCIDCLGPDGAALAWLAAFTPLTVGPALAIGGSGIAASRTHRLFILGGVATALVLGELPVVLSIAALNGPYGPVVYGVPAVGLVSCGLAVGQFLVDRAPGRVSVAVGPGSLVARF